MGNTPLTNKAKLKALLLFLFLSGAIILLQFTPLKETVSPERIKGIISGFGPWMPAIFILSYAISVCLFLPALLFTSIGAVLFGPYWGFLYNSIGALIGASVAFNIGRYLGRDFAASIIGARLKKYDDDIARNGFATVLYLRLIFFPFTPLNFGMGLTRVSFKDFFFGTLLGNMSGGFVITFFIANLAEIIKSADYSQLLNAKTVFSLTIFIASFFIPKLVKKIRPHTQTAEPDPE